METLSERLWGLTEMLPDPVWSAMRRSCVWSIWFVRRAGWVVGVSLAMTMLPIITEQQRLELEEMQNMQKRQVSCSTLYWGTKLMMFAGETVRLMDTI